MLGCIQEKKDCKKERQGYILQHLERIVPPYTVTLDLERRQHHEYRTE